MDTFFELRMELTVSVADQLHLALFVTDDHGQWLLLDDWTAETDQRQVAVGEAVTMVDTWLAFGGRLTPA